jgi:hypothetical protein
MTPMASMVVMASSWRLLAGEDEEEKPSASELSLVAEVSLAGVSGEPMVQQ